MSVPTLTGYDPYSFAHAFTGEAKHAGPPNYTSRKLEAAAIIAGVSQLYGFTVFSTNVATQFIWVFDALSLPANATAPSGPVISVGAAQDRDFTWLYPRQFNAGIVIANSTSSTSFTTGAADCWFDVQYA